MQAQGTIIQLETEGVPAIWGNMVEVLMGDVTSQMENLQKSYQRLSHVTGVEMGIWRHIDK